MTNTVRAGSGNPDSIRRDHRVTVPLTAVIDGRADKVQNWSFGGFQVMDFWDQMREGDELSGQLVLPYEASTMQLNVRFRVVWRNKTDVGCRFIDLPRPVRLALQHLLTDAMEGRLDEVSVPIEAGAERLEERNEAQLKVGRRRLIQTLRSYLAAAAVVLLVSLLLVSWETAFTDSPTGASEEARVVEEGSSISEPISGTPPPAEEAPPILTQSSPAPATSARPAPATFAQPTPAPPVLAQPVSAPPTLEVRVEADATADPAEVVAVRIGTPGAAVQLGAFGSEEGARRYADKVAQSSPRLPEGAEYYLRPITLGDPNSLVRLLVGPLAASDSGEVLCWQFHEAGYDCIVRSASWWSGQG